MLNKLKYGGLIAAALMLVRVVLPDLLIPEGLEDGIMLVIVFISQFFIKESPKTVASLVVE